MDFKDFYIESGFAGLRRILMGTVPSVDTVGIVTANNPMAVKYDKKPNAEFNNQMLQDLKAGGYGPIQMQGHYGNKENTFLIRNISRDELVGLGKKYNQESVIWGSKKADPQGNPYFSFEFIVGDNTVDTKNLSLSLPGIQNRKDFFSQKNGRKFIIPFFDDPYSNFEPKSKFGTFGPKEHVSYFENELPESASSLIETVQNHSELLKVPGKTEKYYWTHRSIVSQALSEIQKLV